MKIFQSFECHLYVSSDCLVVEVNLVVDEVLERFRHLFQHQTKLVFVEKLIQHADDVLVVQILERSKLTHSGYLDPVFLARVEVVQNFQRNRQSVGVPHAAVNSAIRSSAELHLLRVPVTFHFIHGAALVEIAMTTATTVAKKKRRSCSRKKNVFFSFFGGRREKGCAWLEVQWTKRGTAIIGGSPDGVFAFVATSGALICNPAKRTKKKRRIICVHLRKEGTRFAGMGRIG